MERLHIAVPPFLLLAIVSTSPVHPPFLSLNSVAPDKYLTTEAYLDRVKETFENLRS